MATLSDLQYAFYSMMTGMVEEGLTFEDFNDLVQAWDEAGRPEFAFTVNDGDLWDGTAPTNVADAINRIAQVVGAEDPIPALEDA
jgi:hypothetical protein